MPTSSAGNMDQPAVLKWTGSMLGTFADVTVWMLSPWKLPRRMNSSNKGLPEVTISQLSQYINYTVNFLENSAM